MSEKVLFEFRAEENEEGYTFVIKHDKEAYSAWCPPFMKKSFSSLKKDMRRHFREHHRYLRRRMRRRLKFYERMYEDLYGPWEESEEEEKETKK